MVEKTCKYGFLVIDLQRSKYGTVIGNPTIECMTPKDPGGYDEIIQVKYSPFDKSKEEKKNARKVIQYKKLLGVEESIRALMLHAVEEWCLEALKEKYIASGGFKMIEHLQTKVSKDTNRDKVQLKRKCLSIGNNAKSFLPISNRLTRPEHCLQNGK